MKRVLLQIGHFNAEQLTGAGLRAWRDVNTLRRSTGAAGERDYHFNKVLPILRDLLLARGDIQLFIADATYRADLYNQDFDLFAALHYDGGGTENRCMVSAPLATANPRYLNPEAQKQSERFCDIWRRVYPPKTGTVNRNERITAGMREYYVFDYVSYDTPSVIIEHFNHTSPKGEELKNNPRAVAEADYQAIIEFLGLPQNVVKRPTDLNGFNKLYDKTKEVLSSNLTASDKVTELKSLFV